MFGADSTTFRTRAVGTVAADRTVGECQGLRRKHAATGAITCGTVAADRAID